MNVFTVQKYSLCRLCLCGGEHLMDIFDGNVKTEFVIEEAIRDLLQFQVLREVSYPWMICMPCLEKLAEFRIFKIRCTECKVAFENRFRDEVLPERDTFSDRREQEDSVPMKEVLCETVLDEQEGNIKIEPCDDEPIKDQLQFSPASSRQGASSPVLSEENREAMPFGYVEHYKVRESEVKLSESQELVCCTCGEVLQNDNALAAHTRLHETGDEFGIDLDVAGTSQTKEGSRGEEAFPVEFEVVSENITVEPVKKRRRRSRKCKFCGKMFQHIGDYNKHIRIHADEKLYGCTVCPKRFNQRYSLTCHMRIHNNEKPYKCDICNKTFRRQPNLRDHIRIHTGDKPYCCEICGKRFAQCSSLITHTRVHKGVKAFKCDSCDKCFVHNYDLKIHKKRHTGIKNFGCDTCGRFFYEKHLLRFHVMTHIDERPCECPICGKRFTKKDFLVTHSRRHTGETPYECKECGKKYKWLSNYKYHLKLHQRENN